MEKNPEEIMDSIEASEPDSKGLYELKAKAKLEQIVDSFNKEFSSWRNEFGFGANFGFAYDEDGRKSMKILDMSESSKESVSKDQIANAEKLISAAMESSIHLNDEQKSEAREAAELAVKRLTDSFGDRFSSAVTESLTGLDAVVLNSLGIHPELIMQDVIKKKVEEILS